MTLVPLLVGAAFAVDASRLPLDQHGFTHVVAAMVRDRGCAVTVTAPLQLAVACSAGEGSSVSLATAWSAWESDPGAREAALAAGAEAASLVDRLRHPNADGLRVVVRTGAQLHALVQRRPDDPPAAWPLTRDLWAVLVLDAPGVLGFVGVRELRRLGLDRDAALQQALANLDARFGAPVVQCSGPVFMLEAEGAYDASLLLLDDLWYSRAERTGGVLYTAAPDPGVLLWADGRDPNALANLRNVVQQAQAGGGTLTSDVLRWDGSGWTIVAQ